MPTALHWTEINPQTGTIAGLLPRERRLASLADLFLDQTACRHVLQTGNPLVYRVTSVEPAQGEGQLHYGLGTLMPGKIGPEYFFTAGHLHALRPAAEFYIGLAGDGRLLLEHETTGATELLPLRPQAVVYVPGHTAHRTINCGSEPLTYLGLYPAQAGHDYGAIAARNFRHVVVDIDGEPTLMERQAARQRFQFREKG